MNLIFTNATSQDAPAIAELVNSAYRGDSSRRGWTTEADLLGGQRTDPRQVLDIIGAPHSVVLLARCNETSEIFGCTHLEKSGEQLNLGMLTINPNLQGRGLGRRLVEEAERMARISGCREIAMTVISVRKELIDWYERLGFLKTSETKPFPVNDPRFGLPKVQNLEFIVLRKRVVDQIN